MIFGSLFGQQSPDAPDVDYETPDALKQFVSYGDKNFITNKGQFKDYASTLRSAMKSGNLDRTTAISLLNSRIEPNSKYLSSNKYRRFLEYDVPNKKQDAIIQGAAQTNFYRNLDSDDLDAYKTLAQSMGKAGTAADLSNFIQTRMAGTLEAQNKYKDDSIREKEAIYGRALRDEIGNLTGEYGFFGMGEEGAAQAQAAKDALSASTAFTQNYLKKLGAK